MRVSRRIALGIALGLLHVQCASTPEATRDRAQNAAGANSSCPARMRAPALLPGVQSEEATLAYWLKRYTQAELDAVLMDDVAIAAYNLRVGRRPGRDSFSQRDLRVPLDPLVLQAETRERVGSLRPDLLNGKLLTSDNRALSESELAPFSHPAPAMPAPSLRVVLEPTTMRCGPYPGALYRPDGGGITAYDKNSCGLMRAQDVVELLGKADNGMWLARTRSAFGWLPGDVKVSPVIPAALRDAYLQGPRVETRVALPPSAAGGATNLPEHTLVPKRGRNGILVASAERFREVPRPATVHDTTRPMTRRAVLEAAFAYLDTAYGLGGTQGGLDCSGLLVDLFSAFDIALPRFSGWQAEAGSYSVDVQNANDSDKLKRIDLAAKSGIVLAYFPGHIMLYLGKNQSGEPMALHALGEFAQPCSEGRETVVDVQRTVVSGLELGKGSTRRSLLERITRVVVLGGEPPSDLAKFVVPGPSHPPRMPAANSCRDSLDARVFVSPIAPVAGQPLRVIATLSKASGDASLWVYDSDGQPVPLDELRLGGPPFARVARTLKAPSGTFTAVVGTDQKQLACKRFKVRDTPQPAVKTTDTKFVWEPKNDWERDTEALFAVFVEQLFTGAPDDEQTWTNLHSLLRDPSRNLLYDHLGFREEEKLEIEPDCADLPYALRAYFSWKLKLPYGFRQCSRGRTGKPPSCGELRTSLMPRTEGADDVEAFATFVNRAVRSGVHSATGRTAPNDSTTDLYPIALERASLPPGTVYADPYGHVMMVSKWFNQGQVSGDQYGVLIAAEAQPDGTIGRRRFWQGSFLFDPNTENVGAGFKRFRPLSYDKATQSLTALDNDALKKTRDTTPFSLQQYEGTRDEFYERMDELINPKPLPPEERLRSLVDAFDESVRRRVLSVDNGEDYARAHPTVVVPMPTGHDVFETEGAWEDFATPSRDMRLLIALDTVNALPERVIARPDRFALPAGTSPKAAADALRQALAKELGARTFEYTRSDGAKQTLTLAEVAARAKALEVAYNPNDCVELRWGAPADTAERKSCKRSAPAAQRERMETYRDWFRKRQRPARD
jgi:hypothetical protein